MEKSLDYCVNVDPDPRIRSYLIHRFQPLGADPEALLQQFDVESKIDIQRALLMSVGEFDEGKIPIPRRNPLIEKLEWLYEENDDPGLHAEVEWLLRKWGKEAWLASKKKKCQVRKGITLSCKRSYLNVEKGIGT